ncbi:hypothetical protein BC351_24075 [Paenibacillus ferrarius]|uniref:ABC transporter substrate-binding protein n=1 Tax=Paenibacillus ferrarius TaxID=1469647 RepID=A0A1V4HLS1_9BACL|nr:extracellular solute-binding protein [Paenibacillus ferrarius]OPH58429.1 hypothetical protein BC351_24075 [Paenibacillus ferrarius]
MTKKWFKVLTGAMMVASVVTLSACGAGGEKPAATTDSKTAAATPATSDKPVTLRIVWWGSQTRHEATQKALDLYTTKHPNVKFEPEFSGFDGYFQKLSTQAAAHNAADIIQMDAAYLAEYAGRGQLADLSQGINLADVDKTLVDSGKYSSKQFAIPLGNNAMGMGYNKAVVDSLGIKAPSDGWTWDDYFQFGKEAKAKLGADKFALYNSLNDLFSYDMYQLSKGKGYSVTQEGKFNIDKDTWMEWANKHLELTKAGVVLPPDQWATDKIGDPKQDVVINGKSLIRRTFASEFPGLATNLKGAALVTSPKGSGYLKPSMFWSVSADSKNAAESKKFIDWFINDQEAANILGTSRGIPVSKKILKVMEPTFNPTDKAQVDLINKTAPNAQPFNPGAVGWGNFQKDYASIVDLLSFGKSTVDKTYDEIVKKAKEYEKNASQIAK